MIELVRPSTSLLPSWMAAVDEFAGARIPGSGDFLMAGGRVSGDGADPGVAQRR